MKKNSIEFKIYGVVNGELIKINICWMADIWYLYDTLLGSVTSTLATWRHKLHGDYFNNLNGLPDGLPGPYKTNRSQNTWIHWIQENINVSLEVTNAVNLTLFYWISFSSLDNYIVFFFALFNVWTWLAQREWKVCVVGVWECYWGGKRDELENGGSLWEHKTSLRSWRVSKTLALADSSHENTLIWKLPVFQMSFAAQNK